MVGIGESAVDPGGLVVVGAGPAGLTAGYAWMKHGGKPLVLEAASQVGGIARTERYRGYRFDIGGHRFFTKVDAVQRLWEEILGEEFLQVPRLSRIFYRDKFYYYPLQVRNALTNLGLRESVHIMLSYLKWKVRPSTEEDNFEQWVSNRFGGRLYWHFFRTYTEKVWGIPCTQIRADWAAQRIKDLSFLKAAFGALGLSKSNKPSTLITQFHYPRLGPGMMWERCEDLINAGGGEVRLRTRVQRINLEGKRVASITTVDDEGREEEIQAEHYISSMPVTELIQQMRPAPPAEVLRAAEGLKYRDFLIVALITEDSEPFPDNWIYIHSPDVKVGRIQNFRSWSRDMVPDDQHTSLGMEYFCQCGDGLWEMDDAELIDLAGTELDRLGLGRKAAVVDGTVVRQKKAYPVYDPEYKANLDVLSGYLKTLENLQTVGRNGMHRYNNQDHSMLTALLAVRNCLGEEHDLWEVNTERSYHEDFMTKGREAEGGLPPSDRSPGKQACVNA